MQKVYAYRYNGKRKRDEWKIHCLYCSSDKDKWKSWEKLLGADARKQAECLRNFAQKRKTNEEKSKKRQKVNGEEEKVKVNSMTRRKSRKISSRLKKIPRFSFPSFTSEILFHKIELENDGVKKF